MDHSLKQIRICCMLVYNCLSSLFHCEAGCFTYIRWYQNKIMRYILIFLQAFAVYLIAWLKELFSFEHLCVLICLTVVINFFVVSHHVLLLLCPLQNSLKFVAWYNVDSNISANLSGNIYDENQWKPVNSTKICVKIQQMLQSRAQHGKNRLIPTDIHLEQ